MIPAIVTSLRAILFLSILTGLVYPLMVTAVAQLFSAQAHGSLIRKDGHIVGSELIAQKFVSLKYFHSRPSATEYATVPSGASNFGPTSSALTESVDKRRKDLGTNVPSDLVTTSASGLDPHITPEAALFQVDRIIRARGLNESQRQDLLSLIQSHTDGLTMGIMGSPRVNVLKLNIDMEEMFHGR